MKASSLFNFQTKLILASKSPRRKQLLESLGLDFEVKPSNVNEDTIFNADPGKYVIELAKAKATKVAIDNPGSIVIGSDTTVYHNGNYLNKPKDHEEAFKMLSTLSGSIHEVYSGICVFDSSNMTIENDFSVTQVKFRNLDKEEIKAYIESGSPFDKAGAYGIQDDFGAIFVEEIKGDFYNVVGMPLVKLYNILRGISV
jgi:septum formation protein